MNIFQFSQEFPTEKACREHLRQQREQAGIICKKCLCTEHYWKKDKQQWQCKKCLFRTTLRSGTIMESSNLKVLTWYKAMFLMTVTKRSISALEMQRQLGLKRYEPVWYMMHKIRVSMGKRDDNYSLKGNVELDEGLFVVTGRRIKNEPLKSGSGSQRQGKVLVMAESEPVLPNPRKPYRKARACGHFKMKKLESFKAIEIAQTAANCLTPETDLITDASASHNKLLAVVRSHSIVNKQPKANVKLLPWVHVAIANAKRSLLGTYHQVKDCFLQNYLNEFCYKLNRRKRGTLVFNSLLITAVTDVWY